MTAPDETRADDSAIGAVMGFTRAEWIAAQSLVMSSADAEESVGELFAYYSDLTAKAGRGELTAADEAGIDLGFDIQTFVRFAQLGGDTERRATEIARAWLARLPEEEREVLLADRTHLRRFWP